MTTSFSGSAFFRRRFIAAALLFVFAAAEISVSVPKLHAHAAEGAAESGAVFCGAGPQHSHAPAHTTPHECLACRVFTLALTLTRGVTTAAPIQQVAGLVRTTFVAQSSTFSPSVRGRAPPVA